MRIDPTDGLPFDEQLKMIWSGMSPKQQEWIDAMAIRHDMPRVECIKVLLEKGVDFANDPANKEQVNTFVAFLKHPFRKDPKIGV